MKYPDKASNADREYQLMKEQEVISESELELARAAWEREHSPHDPYDYTTYPGWTPSDARALTGLPKLFANGYRWEMDESGWHRIVDDQGRGGDWSDYTHYAVSPDGNYLVFTQYYSGGVPVEALIEMKVIAAVPETDPMDALMMTGLPELQERKPDAPSIKSNPAASSAV
jgi:hypothetical protein